MSESLQLKLVWGKIRVDYTSYKEFQGCDAPSSGVSQYPSSSCNSTSSISINIDQIND